MSHTACIHRCGDESFGRRWRGLESFDERGAAGQMLGDLAAAGLRIWTNSRSGGATVWRSNIEFCGLNGGYARGRIR
jgi:hypothetical protein